MCIVRLEDRQNGNLLFVKCTPMILGERVAAGGQLLVLSKLASHVGHMCD